MSDFQQRVVDEANELGTKIAKLGEFLLGEIFVSLSQDEQFRLRLQFGIMQAYQDVLTERIRNFATPPAYTTQQMQNAGSTHFSNLGEQ